MNKRIKKKILNRKLIKINFIRRIYKIKKSRLYCGRRYKTIYKELLLFGVRYKSSKETN